jgi:acyl-CoA reductase-like NAD-dependent aldehyde dehydrogenase
VSDKMFRTSPFIDGAWVTPAGPGVISVTNPATEETIGEVPQGTADDIDAAVKAAGVWSADPQRARGVARQIRSGQIRINNGAPNPLAPFGGFRQSGHGREYGKFGLEEFLSPKSLQL